MGLLIRKRYRAQNDVTLFHGDCLALLRTIPDGEAQVIVTSPPYNVGKEYEQKQSTEGYLRCQEAAIAECVRIVRPGGSLCWQVGHYLNGHRQVVPLDLLLHPLFAAHERTSGVRLRNRIVWCFGHGLHCKRRFSGRHETILWYTKGDDYVFNLDAVRVPQKYPGKRAYKGPRKGQYSCNPLGKNPGDVWVFPNVKSHHVEKMEHPCQFPIELPERLILAFSQPGDLVLDPFLGIGTTAVAAVLHSRRAAGADLIEKYLEVARRRVELAARGQVPRRPMGLEVYAPTPGTPLTTIPAEFLSRWPTGLRQAPPAYLRGHQGRGQAHE